MARTRKQSELPDLTVHWAFRARFRARAFGWKSSTLAIERLKEALSEIKAVSRHDRLRGADGAVLLIERISPAFEQVDSSSGALGTAVNRAIADLVTIIAAAPANDVLRRHWLERLFDALQNDSIPYIETLGHQWGELCVTPVLAAEWADRLVPTMLAAWEDTSGYVHFPGTMAALSAMLRAERYEGLLFVTPRCRYDWWSIREYRVLALAALGRIDDAIAVADVPDQLMDDPTARARTIEQLLLDAGRRTEAYQYALIANAGTNRLSTFRAVKKKYPEYEPVFILKDLIRRTPGQEGKWFATAKTLGLYELALELADRSPVDHHTLMRAVRDYAATRPSFALRCAMAAVRWMADGYGYDLACVDMRHAVQEALKLAEGLGQQDEAMARLQQLAICGTEAAGWLHAIVGPPRP